MGKYPKAKAVYKKLVTKDLIGELSICGITENEARANNLVDYFIKHGLTKFYQVAFLQDDEIEKLPVDSAEDKKKLVQCIAKAKAAADVESKDHEGSRQEL